MMIKLIIRLVVMVTVFFAITLPQVNAATLSPAQMAMLNSLPPAQRAQAMAMVSQMRSRGGGQPAAAAPTSTQSAVDAEESALKAQLEAEKKKMEELDANASLIPFQPGDSLIIYFFNQAEALSFDKAQKGLLEEVKDALDQEFEMPEARFVPDHKQLLFKLNYDGVLEIPGLGRIPLAGLNEEQAAARLNAEPLLQDYKVRIKQLPLEPIGKEALKPFGYELFNDPENLISTMRNLRPNPNIPVPSDYVIGPGDVVNISMFGKENYDQSSSVTRDGTLVFPGLGAIPVTGLSFDELKANLKRRAEKQFIGVSVDVTLGELRSIQVYVLGEVEQPGAYHVSSLSTVSYAILRGRGIKPYGSLRNIQLKRNGRLVKTIDLYELLLRGSRAHDERLQPGDVVYVPPVGASVGITGQVKRPAIYELKKDTDVKTLVALAGGVLPDAFISDVQIERIVDGHDRRVLDINLRDPKLASTQVKDGDLVYVDPASQRLQNVVYLKGHVIRPGWLQWRKNMRLVDAIPEVDDLKPDADLDYVLVKRYLPPTYQLSVVSASLREALANPQSGANIALEPRDEVLVFSASEKRVLQVKPIVDQLLSQAALNTPGQVVRVGGEVRAPGDYPLEADMRISDLIRAGGKLKESAYTVSAELTRYVVEKGSPRKIQHLNIDLAGILNGIAEKDLVLQPYDRLNVKEIPLWKEQELVELGGEVRFPGKYTIERGETLSSLINRAGGLTDFAYPRGAVFMRAELRRREQSRMEEMASNLEAELAAISLERSGDPSQVQAAGAAKSLLSKLRNTEATGRLVIDLEQALNKPGNRHDLVLRGGDQLMIPATMQEVTVIGEVFHPTSHIYNGDLDAGEYIDLSGGITRKADKGRTYIIKADGSVVAAKKMLSLARSIHPGDTIVVPLDAERIDSLRLWTSITEIVYQLGVAAAAWNTLGVF